MSLVFKSLTRWYTMKGRRLFRYLAAVSGLAGLACGDYASPTSPLEKKDVSLTVPTGAVYSRWMLISGVWVCVDKCDDSRQQASGIGVRLVPLDTLP
jgi:hypothetical protein